MKRLVFTIATILSGCSPVEVTYRGSGDFIIQNKSTIPIRVEIAKRHRIDTITDTSNVILPDSTRIIFSHVEYDGNVYPNSTLTSMKIYKDSSGILSLVYSQDTIDQSKWIIDKKYSGDFGHTVNTFEFRNELLKK